MSLTVTSELDPEISFSVCAFVKDDLNIGSDIIYVSKLQEKHPVLESANPTEYRFSDAEKILDQDVYEYIRPLEYGQDKSQKTLFAVRLPIGWVMSGPLLSSNALISTRFKCKIGDVCLVEQVKSWYELESYGAYKQVDDGSQLIIGRIKSSNQLPYMMVIDTPLACSGLKTTQFYQTSFSLSLPNRSLWKNV